MPAPRLSALLASEAPVWDRDTDEFTRGARFKGTIYPERSDVSPDGRRLIYFAMAGVKWAVAETGGTWTAISTVPSLTASALWGQGGTWGGGGMFLSNDSFWLNVGTETFLIRNESGLRRETYEPNLRYRSREERDGWITRYGNTSVPLFEKAIPGSTVLRRVGWDRRI